MSDTAWLSEALHRLSLRIDRLERAVYVLTQGLERVMEHLGIEKEEAPAEVVEPWRDR